MERILALSKKKKKYPLVKKIKSAFKSLKNLKINAYLAKLLLKTFFDLKILFLKHNIKHTLNHLINTLTSI